MTSEQYVYWCQGFVELTGGVHPTPEQWKMIREHLALVFTKVTPPLEDPKILLADGPPKQLDLLNEGPICGKAQQRKEEPSYCKSDHSRDHTKLELKDEDLKSIKISSGLIGGWSEKKIFITISSKPSFTAKSYSYYPFHSYADSSYRAAQENLLKSIGVEWDREEVFCVVDNSLKPKETELNNLAGSSDHLTSLHPRFPGIVNVGVRSPLIC